MKHSIIALISFCCRIASIASMTQHVIIEGGNSSISTSSLDLLNFVRHSGVIIDKTLMIKYVLNNNFFINSTLLITCHHGMGKTLNLDAIASFLSIEVDRAGNKIPIEKTSSYRLFVTGEVPSEDEKTIKKFTPPLLISKEKKTIENYLGQYPVIRLDFSELRFFSYNETMIYFKKALSRTFEAHKYMLAVFEKKIIQGMDLGRIKNQTSFFVKILRQQEHDEEKIATSVRFLSEILFEYFQKRVYIFVDEYDTPLNDMYLNPKSISYNRDRFKYFFEMFMYNSTIANSYMITTFMTGVIELDDDPYRLGKFKKIYNCKREEFHQYYGICEKDLDHLLQATNISSNQKKEVVTWYNGYRFGKNKNVSVSNLRSVAQFINSRKFGSYWTEKPTVDSFLSSALNNPYFREKFSDLVYNNSVKLLLKPQDELFYIEHYDRFREVMNQVIELSTSYAPRSILNYMYVSGYLEKQEEDYPEDLPDVYNMRIPNLQFVTVMSKKLESFYKVLEFGGYDMSPCLIMQEEFPLFLFNNDTSSPKLTKALENFVNEPPEFVKNITTDFDFRNIPLENESALRIIIGFLTFKLKCSKIGSEVIFRRVGTNLRLCSIFFHEDKMTVFRVKWNEEEVDYEADEIEDWKQKYFRKITTVKYITVTADVIKKIHVEVEMKRL